MPLNTRKILVLAVCFLITGCLVFLPEDSRTVIKKEQLQTALADLDQWKQNAVIPMDERIVQELKLDDYANQTYVKGPDSLFLYIGYYYNNKKVGAAHDPLVCFPGQGWKLLEKEKGDFVLRKGKGEKIHYATMTISRGQEKQLVLYWFQSFDETSSNTFQQKLRSLRIRIFKKRGDNAFVRITIPYGASASKEQLVKKVENFVEAFYPVFLAYVKDPERA